MSRFWSRIIRFRIEDFPKVTKALKGLGGSLLRYEFDRREGTIKIKVGADADLSEFDILNNKSESKIINRALKVRIRPLDQSTVQHFNEVHLKILSDFADKVAIGTYQADQYLSLVFGDAETKKAFRKAINQHLPFLVMKE
jgi:hypothetical protein